MRSFRNIREFLDWCDDHNLTVCLLLSAINLWIIGWQQEDEWLKGFIVDLGHDCASGAILFMFSWGLREKVKPEDG